MGGVKVLVTGEGLCRLNRKHKCYYYFFPTNTLGLFYSRAMVILWVVRQIACRCLYVM